MATFDHDVIVPDASSALSKKEQVADMFDDIAFRYDFLNRFLSAGIDVSWRRKALGYLKSLQPKRMLDVATGTADVALMAVKQLRPEHVTGIDISEGMLNLGKQKVAKAGLQRVIELEQGDSEAMRFANNSFDAVTVSFGVRNFQNLEKGLAEILRVLQPGGKLVVLEFSRPKSGFFKYFYNLYMNSIAPGMGKLFSRNKCAYKYLDESIKKFPEGANFTQILKETGYRNIEFKPLSFGICTIYCAQK